MIRIVLDGKPRGKERVRFNRKTGTAFTPQRTVSFESRLAFEAQHVMNGRPLLDGPLDVTMLVEMPIAASWPEKKRRAALCGDLRPVAKPDADNFAKIMDALNLVVWQDDAQIVGLHVYKFYSDRPRTEIFIGPATRHRPFIPATDMFA